jgi:outer membrane immunogenic protein
LVAGIETDLSYLHANQNSLVTYTGAPLVQTQVSTAYHWFGTTRGRLGYLVTGATMIYATGGLAYARIDHSAVVQTNPTVSETSTRTGWTVGGGVEYALNAAWSVKGEYLYADLGTATLDTSATTGGPGAGTASTTSWSHKLNIARFGVNYKF